MEQLALRLIDDAPVSLRRLTVDMDDDSLRRRPQPQEWSIVEIAGHLVDKAEVWGERLRRIAAEDRPFLPAYDQDARVVERGYRSQSLDGVVKKLEELSRALTSDLRALPAEDWQKIGVHEERGQMTLAEATRIYAISLPDHVEQLIATRDAVLKETEAGWAPRCPTGI